MSTKRLSRRSQDYLWTVFVIPVVVYLFATQIYPLLSAVRMSFYATIKGKDTFVGFSHYLELLRNPLFWEVSKNTVVFTVASVFMHILIGLLMANLLNANIVNRQLFRSLQLVPWLFPPMIACIFWLLMYQQRLGFINNFLLAIGWHKLALEWLGNPHTAMISVVIVNLWIGYAFYSLMFLTSLQSIPISLYEAAEIDGAGKWTKFIHITLPYLRPIILTLIILDSIWTFRVFDQIWILTRGGPIHLTELLGTFTYKTAFWEFNFNKAASIGGYSLLVLVVLSLLYLRLYTRKASL